MAKPLEDDRSHLTPSQPVPPPPAVTATVSPPGNGRRHCQRGGGHPQVHPVIPANRGKTPVVRRRQAVPPPPTTPPPTARRPAGSPVTGALSGTVTAPSRHAVTQPKGAWGRGEEAGNRGGGGPLTCGRTGTCSRVVTRVDVTWAAGATRAAHVTRHMPPPPPLSPLRLPLRPPRLLALLRPRQPRRPSPPPLSPPPLSLATTSHGAPFGAAGVRGDGRRWCNPLTPPHPPRPS